MSGWETVEAVRRGDLTVGTFLSSASAVVADVAARGGLDWLVIDLEHGVPDLSAAAGIVRSLRTNVPVLARTPPSDRHSTEAMLDAGAAGIIIPRVEGAVSATAELGITQYAGGRGLARTTPRFGWGADTTDPLDVDHLILRVVQIETTASLDEVETIAALPMVDVLFLGPADLRLDLRRHERDSSTALESAACRVVAAARSASKVAGTLVRSVDVLEEWWMLGYTFLACSADVLMVADGARGIAAEAVRLRRTADRASALGSATLRATNGYRSVDQRLAEWRRASLARQGRLEELAQVPDPDFHGRNIATQVGAITRVDSFLSTVNSDDPASAYAPPNRVEARGFRFKREELAHPTLLKLRDLYKLLDVAGQGDDLSRAVRLRKWVNQRWPHEVPLSNPPYNGLTILERAANGEGFLCMHYAVTLMQCCLAVGIEARVVNLHRGVAVSYPIGEEDTVDPPVDEHVVIEIYALERNRWVMLDPDFDCHFELYNEPLSAWEIHNVRLTGERITAVKGPGALPYEGLRSSGRAGPLLGDAARDDRARTEWYETTLPDYYAHVSIWMRNDFLSDPEARCRYCT